MSTGALVSSRNLCNIEPSIEWGSGGGVEKSTRKNNVYKWLSSFCRPSFLLVCVRWKWVPSSSKWQKSPHQPLFQTHTHWPRPRDQTHFFHPPYFSASRKITHQERYTQREHVLSGGTISRPDPTKSAIGRTSDEGKRTLWFPSQWEQFWSGKLVINSILLTQ